MRLTYLYRMFGADNTLLYIGISISAVARISQHYKDKEWAHEVVRILITPYESREDALEGEKIAIATERPKYNTHHNLTPTVEFTPSVAARARGISEGAASAADPDLKVYTRAEAAEMLGISVLTLDRLHAAGSGPARLRLSARRVGYRARDLIAWARGRALSSAPSPGSP